MRIKFLCLNCLTSMQGQPLTYLTGLKGDEFKGVATEVWDNFHGVVTKLSSDTDVLDESAIGAGLELSLIHI